MLKLNTRRKICVITGSRAEYGQLYWLLTEINRDPALELQLLVTGMHLSPEFGYTSAAIEKDGFEITEKIEMLVSSDTPTAITKSIGLGVISFADFFKQSKPDIVVILGDRFEIFAAAIAAYIARIPIAHIHGGEVTAGCIDEGIRHSITKMASIHFVSNREHYKRVMQLGENPRFIFNYGAPGLDYIKRTKLLSKSEWRKKLQLPPDREKKIVLITIHPVSLGIDSSEHLIKSTLSALEKLKNCNFIFTCPNADTEGRIILKYIIDFVRKHEENANFFSSLGQLKYLSTLKYADIMIGNSSSGLIEAPSFGLPVVNIGSRQQGRMRAENVIDCAPNEKQILSAIHRAMARGKRKIKNPYGGDGKSSIKIKNKLKRIKLHNIIIKKFFDIGD